MHYQIMILGFIVILRLLVIPAQAGIQYSVLWISACAGMTTPLIIALTNLYSLL